MGEAGIEVPEFRWPTTPTTLASTSFCATVVPTFGSAWSSSATRVNFTSLPSILVLAAFASSIAKRAPFSLSLPRCAMPPVRGPTWPIFTSLPPPPPWPQPAKTKAAASAAAMAEMPNWMFFMGSPRGSGQVLTRAIIPRRCVRKATLLLGKDPLHQCVDVGVRHRAVGRHRRLAPDALAAVLDLGRELRRRVLVGAVLGGDVLVGWTDHLLVHRVAGEASVLLRQLFARQHWKRHQECDDDYEGLHAFS